MYDFGLDVGRIEFAKKRIKELLFELGDTNLVCAIMFGSCARGDYKIDSDIDVAILVNCDRNDMQHYTDIMVDIATDIAMEEPVEISFICIPYQEYIEKKDWYYFYKNIEKEGIIIYGRKF